MQQTQFRLLVTTQPRHQPVKHRVRGGERSLRLGGCVPWHPAPSSSDRGVGTDEPSEEGAPSHLDTPADRRPAPNGAHLQKSRTRMVRSPDPTFRMIFRCSDLPWSLAKPGDLGLAGAWSTFGDQGCGWVSPVGSRASTRRRGPSPPQPGRRPHRRPGRRIGARLGRGNVSAVHRELVDAVRAGRRRRVCERRTGQCGRHCGWRPSVKAYDQLLTRRASQR
jgi:hypothetical protein